MKSIRLIKHILVQQIKKESETSIILYRDQIAKKLKKRSLIHSDQEVKAVLNKLQAQFKDYQLALYLYSYSTFLESAVAGQFRQRVFKQCRASHCGVFLPVP